MLSSLRRGSAILRSVRIASYSPSSTVSARPFRPYAQTPLYKFQCVASFSTSRGFRAETAPQQSTQEVEPAEYTKFQELADHNIISNNVVRTITEKMDIHTMTDVQRMTLNSCLDGSDVIAQAKTGTGKTLAFLTPIVQRILRDQTLDQRPSPRDRVSVDIRALIVSPTRELAEQIAAEARRLVSATGIKVQTAVGGTGKQYHLRKMKTEGCHLLVGTPGRINDLLSDPSSGVTMENIETFVLDEADRLLDIGFMPAIEEMQTHMPPRTERPRQTLMFSATVPKTVVSLVRRTMRPDFKFVRTIDPDEAPTHERIPQNVVFMNGLENQLPAILEIAKTAISKHEADPANTKPFKCIVYFGATTQTDMAFEVFRNLRDASISSSIRTHPLNPCKIFRMNGGLTQQQREKETFGFRRAESAILFSTDVTARGMDFPDVSHVIQLGLPKNEDDYIHRLGRTGRAGKDGEGWLLLNEDEKRDFARAFSHKGISMKPQELATASLDMSKGAQLTAQVAKILQMIEVGVKSVPYSVKASVYKSLLGVMQQQFPGRAKQDQIDMMNNLARYGWGLPKPPSLPAVLVDKLGYSRCNGIELEEPRSRGGRDSDRDFGRRSSRSDNDDPFGMGFGGGKGVFGGGNSSSGSRRSYNDDPFGRSSDRGDRGDRRDRRGDGRRRGFGGSRDRSGYNGGRDRGNRGDRDGFSDMF